MRNLDKETSVEISKQEFQVEYNRYIQQIENCL